MKHIYKIYSLAAVAVVLGATSVQASFDNNVYGAQQTGSALLSDQLPDSPNNYGNQTPNNRSSSPGHNQVITPRTPNALVPEPTTVIAGALLLLPFAVSAVRIMRRNQAGQLK